MTTFRDLWGGLLFWWGWPGVLALGLVLGLVLLGGAWAFVWPVRGERDDRRD